MPPNRHVARTFIYIFLLSLGLNIAFLLVSHVPTSPDSLESDAREYFDLAGHIVDGSYHFDSRRVPGHTWILASFRYFTGSNVKALQLLVTALFCLSAPLSYLLARRFVSNEKVAAIVGIAISIWPQFVFYGHTLYSETTALPLFIGFLATLPRGLRLGQANTPDWRWMVSGLLLALCMLTRPMYVIFVPFIPFILWCEDGRSPVVTKALVLVIVGCILTLLPWSIYSSTQSGTLIILSSNGGETLAGGLNGSIVSQGVSSYITPDGRKTWTGPGKWIDENSTGYLTKEELTLPRQARDRLLSKRVIRWIIQNPGPTLRLESAKLSYMWGIYPFWNGLLQTIFGNIPTLLLLLLGLLTTVFFRHHITQLGMLYALPLFASVVALVSWGSWRFRQPGDVGLITLSVFLICTLVSKDKLRFRNSSDTHQLGSQGRICHTT